MPESTAQVFADYLGMTPENAGWAYGVKEILQCLSCLKDVREVPVDEQAFMAVRCDNCCEYLSCGGLVERLTATSPLAPAPTPGWLEVLVMHERFIQMAHSETGFMALAEYVTSKTTVSSKRMFSHPTHAVARALIAADPALRECLEACADWEDSK